MIKDMSDWSNESPSAAKGQTNRQAYGDAEVMSRYYSEVRAGKMATSHRNEASKEQHVRGSLPGNAYNVDQSLMSLES